MPSSAPPFPSRSVRRARAAAGVAGRATAVLAVVVALCGSAAAAFYREAPGLAERVAAGTLPAVDERLPGNPLLIPVEERVGRYGGVWRMAMVGDGDGLLLYRSIGYEPLVRWDPAWRRVVPNVAQSFRLSDDARTVTFQLRPGLRWSDGVPFTAEDIRFWVEDVLLDPELTPRPPRWMPTGPQGVRLEVADPHTVRFHFATPNSLFVAALASGQEWRALTEHPRHALSRYHRRYNPQGIAAEVAAAGVADWTELFHLKAGTFLNRSDPASLLRRRPDPAGGVQRAEPIPTLYAWVLDRLEPGDPPVYVAERNPYYWKVDPAGQQLPYLDRVDVYAAADETAFARLLAGGRIDLQARHVVSPGMQPLLADLFAKDHRPLPIQPSVSNEVPLILNLTHPDPVLRAVLADRDVRVALSRAIDRRAIIERVFGGRGEPYQMAPRPDSRFYVERLARQHLDHDPVEAGRILDAKGLGVRDGDGVRLLPDGRRLSLTVLVRSDRAHHAAAMAMVARQWRAVGVEVTVREVSRRDLIDRIAANRFDAAVGYADGGMDAILDAYAYVPCFPDSQAAPGWAVWHNDPGRPGAVEPPAAVKRQVDLYRRIAETTDPDRQDRLMREVLEIAADEFYTLGIALVPGNDGIVRASFANVPAAMTESWIYPTPGPTNPPQYFMVAP
ncbi:ABC transporter substrate-binding protein [Azospirillum sp. ST 5-10]|uniref:ABC transporter substrate-binding protein n=1 Tax=unclassified Azospirillum TaxID=2630922 RepID=UPI003F4A1FD1